MTMEHQKYPIWAEIQQTKSSSKTFNNYIVVIKIAGFSETFIPDSKPTFYELAEERKNRFNVKIEAAMKNWLKQTIQKAIDVHWLTPFINSQLSEQT